MKRGMTSKGSPATLKTALPGFAIGTHSPSAEAHWQATLACGVLKILIAAAAVALPLLDGRHIASSVGWILIAGGTAEFMLGWSAHRSVLGKVTLGSGILTILAGLLSVASGWTGLFPLASVVIIWLVLRGLISLDIGFVSGRAFPTDSFWLLLRGLVDLGLGLLLLMGVPIAMIVIVAFGVTSTLLTAFSASLSISFLVAGIGLVVIALSQRRTSKDLRIIGAM